MKLERLPVLEQIASSDERCLGAAFTSFTFEPSFFENHVLATILRISADPDESAAAYHEEVLAVLQETPVACVIDGSMRGPGHQLPYDLREVRSRCFHPKVALVLYQSHARVAVGSANLTKQGYGRNAETVFVRSVHYDAPEDALVLRDVLAFFDAVDEQATQGGTQLRAVLETLRRRIVNVDTSDAEPAIRFMHTEADEPLLPRILGLLPDNASITRLGILAPFFERDDPTAQSAEDTSSVLLALAARAGKKAIVDLGVSWDDAPIAPSTGAAVSLSDGVGSVWARQFRDDDRDTAPPTKVRYFVPTGVTANNYRATVYNGDSRLFPKDEIDAEVAARTCWHVGVPRVFAPAALVKAARDAVNEVNIWLHPGSQLHEGRPLERPLHAKLLTIAFRSGNKRRTLVVVGSANASRMALLSTPSAGGNVEACVAFIVDDELTLRDVAPEVQLCAAPVEWQERTFPEPPALPSVPDIQSAVYAPVDKTLTITWSAPSREVGSWSLAYQETVLASGTGTPSEPTVIRPFTLSPTSCEVAVTAPDGTLTWPILVDDLAALPLDGFQRDLDLRNLLALVGRRLTPARQKVLVQRHGAAMLDATLTSLLGENFSPTDVLRAWWSVAQDLTLAGITVAGFKLRLLGSLGARAVWTRLYEMATQPDSGVRSEEAWFYGSELVRALSRVEIPPDADFAPKRRILDEYLTEVRDQLAQLRPSTEARPWVSSIVKFYEGTVS